METLLKPLEELAEYVEAKEELIKKCGVIEFDGCQDAQKLHMWYGFGKQFTQKVIITYSEQKAKEIYEDYQFYEKNVYLYPARDLIFYQADIHGNLLTTQRLECLQALFSGENATIVTTMDAFMEHLIPMERILSSIITLELMEAVDLNEFSQKLVSYGYERTYQVESKGQFSIRGGILDIYPLTEENPIRIELWGDEIDSIRSFDILSQRSLAKLEEITIFPATETILTKEEKEAGIARMEKEAAELSKKFRDDFLTEEAHRVVSLVQTFKEELLELQYTNCNIAGYLDYFYEEQCSLLDYFNKEQTVFFLDEPSRLFEKASVVEAEFVESMKQRMEKGYALKGQAALLYRKEELFAGFETRHTVAMSALKPKRGIYKALTSHSVVAKSMNSYNNSFEALIADLKRFKKNGYRVVLVSSSRTRAERLTEDIREEGLSCYYAADLSKAVGVGEVMVVYGQIKQGFEYPLIRFVVISESDIFTVKKKKKRRIKKYDGQRIQSFTELSVGDYVVHESHGLGIYKGIEQVTVEGVTKDYMKIEYRDGGNLYIPATGLDAIQKYAGKGSAKPKINKLGGTEWTKTKARVKSAVDTIANDLVELYAVRSNTKGFQFSRDTIWQTEFEELFPFEETEDQMLAIEATKQDMESTKIMDRLICGDVGYGKTEIAIRAAFKAVQDGKQVVYLVPTTILAQQHYNTFVQRMKDFPCRVELMSRFRTPLEQKETIKGLKKGFVDIVIGTHRLLSKDIAYKDLGLLIIDEEQRFGVAHKEKIKKMKENIDVLTLTATPIPRTLHMSLVGIRDMSVLEEAPQDRMPIQTFVMEYNEEMVREAISREMARGGQVFYVYNRVKTIADMTATLARLVPEATVVYAHGQMKEHELEKIMFDFVNGDIDVLVSTTIIETGLDIPNVNTIIIHDSDNMGLSQLYQLRGRVGRSNRTAYAFLMYKKDKMLKEVAEKRLTAIREFTELGSGFKIAMRDLEIRGAGNMLGERQSGHMESVGYDLYCKMLNEAIKKRKGIETVEDYSVAVEMEIDAYIPDSYIVNEYQKIDIYKRIASIESEEEKEDMFEELTDRFGELPDCVINLLNIARLRMIAKSVYITEIKQEPNAFKLSIYEKAAYQNEKIGEFLEKYDGQLLLKPVAKPYFIYRYANEALKGEELLQYVEELLLDMKNNLLP